MADIFTEKLESNVVQGSGARRCSRVCKASYTLEKVFDDDAVKTGRVFNTVMDKC